MEGSAIPRRFGAAIPLGRKLPLLISGLLLLVLVVSSWAAYREVSQSTLLAATERLHRVARQLADLSQGSSGNRGATMRAVAADSAVRNLFRAPGSVDTASIMKSFSRLALGSDSMLIAEVWDRAGRRIFGTGAPLRAADREQATRLVRKVAPDDAVRLGGFYTAADTVFFWTAAPVRDGGNTVGHVVQRRRVRSSPRAEKQIQELIGSDMRVFIGDSAGTLWTSLAGVPSTPPVDLRRASGILQYDREVGGRHLAAKAAVAGTPWLVVLEMPLAAVLERSSLFLRRLAVIVALLVLAGAVGASLLSRHVTRPLAALTTAARAMAEGKYGQRVPVMRDDELGRLSATFNVMAARIEESQSALERQFQQARGLALELENARQESERTARRTARLQGVTAALSKAVTPDDVAEIVMSQAVTALDAHAGSIFVMSKDGAALELSRSVGYPAAALNRWARIPLNASLPLAEAARTKRPVFLESPDSLHERYAGVPLPEMLSASRSWATLPLVIDERLLGAMGLSFVQVDAATADERAYMLALAQQCAQALDRSRLYQAETNARRDAEVARVAAEAANRAKSEFLATMSHELRTPLNAIGGYTELIDMGLRGPVSGAQRDDLARIKRSQQHLLTLINDVLHFAKLDAGRVRFEITEVPLDEMLDSLEALIAPQVRAKGLTYTHYRSDVTLTAPADREKLQQIILNLTSNAIKFTEPGGRIDVGCASDGSVVRLCVRDTGIGIPPERLGTIFDPFVQVDRRLTRVHEGIGLGLAISRDLARGMGGDLIVESVVGMGSTFICVLPRRAFSENGRRRHVTTADDIVSGPRARADVAG